MSPEDPGAAPDRPLCFVLMPFGRKPDASGATIDFDAIYEGVLKPAIADAGLEPIRADEEQAGGVIHKPMFERLILCEFAVADLTTANANVFYELGVRHAVRPFRTVLVFAEGLRLPFDVAPLRALPYRLDGSGRPADPEGARRALADHLRAARNEDVDSPLFQLVEGYVEPDVAHVKTDVFRERVRYSEGLKQALARARQEGVEAVRVVEQHLGTLADVDAGVLVDLLLSYRAVEAWGDAIALVERLPAPVARTVLVREQHGFVLNRAGRGADAERVLQKLLDERGPSSETLGILGRVYKDRWEAARDAGQAALAKGLLRKAVDTYRRGFEADWRDAYPGVNVVTLMELADPPDPERERILPIVAYAVERKIARGEPDYWDHATRLELAVLGRDEDAALAGLADALAAVRERWEPETTARNLKLIRTARAGRGEVVEPWLDEVIAALDRSAGV